MSRAKLYPEIRRLREDEGLLFRDIAERVGLSISTVQDYYTDPSGEKVWARKHRAKCAKCGTPIATGDSGWGGKCVPCRGADPETRRRRSGRKPAFDRYTREDCIDALRREAARLGRTPTANGWDFHNLRPTSQTIIKRFGGTWNGAVAAAGLALNKSHRKPDDPVYPDEYLLDNLREYAADHPEAYITGYDRWAMEQDRPSASIVRLRFGGWFAALDAAGIEVAA